jgi:hypothetical protein
MVIKQKKSESVSRVKHDTEKKECIIIISNTARDMRARTDVKQHFSVSETE